MDFAFYKNTAAYYLAMGPKKGRRVRKIEVPTHSVPEFELGDTAANIKRGREEREVSEREEAQQQQQREEETREEESYSQEEGQPEKRHRRERNDTETEAAGGEMGPSQSRYKKGHMTNVYLTDFDVEATVNFVKDHKELYDKTSEHFKDKAGKESLWEEFARSHKLSVKVCKT